jgi:hypothetical protein
MSLSSSPYHPLFVLSISIFFVGLLIQQRFILFGRRHSQRFFIFTLSRPFTYSFFAFLVCVAFLQISYLPHGFFLSLIVVLRLSLFHLLLLSTLIKL